MVATNKVITCSSLYSSFYEEENKSKYTVSALLQSLRIKHFLRIAGKKFINNINAVSVFEVTESGREALNNFDVCEERPRGKGRRLEKKTGACAECAKFGRIYFYKQQYICRECLNPDVPIERPNLLTSSGGFWSEGRYGTPRNSLCAPNREKNRGSIQVFPKESFGE